MNKIKLDDRLFCAAEYVRRGGVAADIGTDHAYLPVYLIENGICDKVIACDINRMPLDSAERTVRRYGLEDKIELRLSDGLSGIEKNECTDIIIAGMGAELIADILCKCNWVKDKKINLVLNPMTKPELLRSFLAENGFDLLSETAAESNNKHYTVMNAVYSGVKRKLGAADKYFGKLADDESNAAVELKKMTAKRMMKKAGGLYHREPNSEEAKLLEAAVQTILGGETK